MMDSSALELALLQHVLRRNYRPVKPKVIAKQLGLSKTDAAELKRAVKRLVRRGKLEYGSNHLVRPVENKPSRSGRVTGVFRRTAKGFGFVRPTSADSVTEKKTEDIYIPAERAGDAASGDTVVVQLAKRRGGAPGPRGEIVEILQRQTHQFVGTYFEQAGSAYVQVDGTLFAQPIRVGDPGAKNVRTDDKVVFEMVRFPSPYRGGEGVITEVLGPRGKPGVDTLSILREFDLPETFPGDVLEEARRQAEQFDEGVPEGRLDLTQETIITIDPADARDFDDAISLTQGDNGHWRLGVHIADVSHFVRPKTALDREARNRATSVYLPDRVIPMLPELISNGLASLQPGKVRLTKSAFLEFTPEGVRVDTKLHNAAIRSAKRLSYEQVDGFLENPEAWRKKLGAKVSALLDRMRGLARVLRRRREQKGALELTLPEVKIELDKSGRVSGARVVPYTESHQMIEEFMLSANEAVAETLHEKDWPFLRRVHQPPTLKKLQDLTEFARDLGYQAESLQNRFALQKLLRESVGRPEQHALHYAALRSLQRAVYSPREEGHFALASECYCHFTSPIRRYPDLTVHRLVEALLHKTATGGRVPRRDRRSRLSERPDSAALFNLGQHCSDREQQAEAAERELTKLKLLAYLVDRVGEEMDAVITGVESFGLFVEGLELPAEGLIRIEALADDFYAFDRVAHTLTGRRAGNAYRLGDRLRVAVARVDLERRELDFRPAGKKKAHPSAKLKRGIKRRKKR
ncbi:MAG: ribonuclease R [Pirellulales bacterium]|nr:ribonuclease R [Pirellulales bacterium]